MWWVTTQSPSRSRWRTQVGDKTTTFVPATLTHPVMLWGQSPQLCFAATHLSNPCVLAPRAPRLCTHNHPGRPVCAAARGTDWGCSARHPSAGRPGRGEARVVGGALTHSSCNPALACYTWQVLVLWHACVCQRLAAVRAALQHCCCGSCMYGCLAPAVLSALLPTEPGLWRRARAGRSHRQCRYIHCAASCCLPGGHAFRFACQALNSRHWLLPVEHLRGRTCCSARTFPHRISALQWKPGRTLAAPPCWSGITRRLRSGSTQQ